MVLKKAPIYSQGSFRVWSERRVNSALAVPKGGARESSLIIAAPLHPEAPLVGGRRMAGRTLKVLLVAVVGIISICTLKGKAEEGRVEQIDRTFPEGVNFY